MSIYLDGIQSQLYHRTLLRCEGFGLLSDHVLLRTTERGRHRPKVTNLHSLSLSRGQWCKNMLYLQLGQLSQLLGGIKDELSALE